MILQSFSYCDLNWIYAARAVPCLQPRCHSMELPLWPNLRPSVASWKILSLPGNSRRKLRWEKVKNPEFPSFVMPPFAQMKNFSKNICSIGVERWVRRYFVHMLWECHMCSRNLEFADVILYFYISGSWFNRRPRSVCLRSSNAPGCSSEVFFFLPQIKSRMSWSPQSRLYKSTGRSIRSAWRLYASNMKAAEFDVKFQEQK